MLDTLIAIGAGLLGFVIVIGIPVLIGLILIKIWRATRKDVR